MTVHCTSWLVIRLSNNSAKNFSNIHKQTIAAFTHFPTSRSASIILFSTHSNSNDIYTLYELLIITANYRGYYMVIYLCRRMVLFIILFFFLAISHLRISVLCTGVQLRYSEYSTFQHCSVAVRPFPEARLLIKAQCCTSFHLLDSRTWSLMIMVIFWTHVREPSCSMSCAAHCRRNCHE